MTNWDNEIIFEAYKKQNRPLEESISTLLKNDLILANEIYNEWTMSDWHNGVKNVAKKAANVGGFLIDKVKKYIVEPLLGSNREVLNKLKKVKSKEELAQLLKTYGEDPAFQLINNEAITNAERRVQKNESYLSFWDLILLEASEMDESLKSSIIDLGNSLGEGGAEIFKDLAETNISLDEVDGNNNLKRLCKFVANLIEDDSEELDDIVKLASVLANLGDVLEPYDDDYEKKYGTEIKKIISNKNFQSSTEKDIVDSITNGSSKETKGDTKSEPDVSKPKSLKSTKAVSKLDPKTKAASAALSQIADVMPTNPQDVQTVINLISNSNKLQGDAKTSLQKAINKGGQKTVKNLVELAGKISTGMIPPPALNILDLLIQRYGNFIITLSDEFKSSKDAKEENINDAERKAFKEVKRFALVFGTKRKFNNFLDKIKSKKIKTKNSEQQAYIQYLNSDGKQFIDAIKLIGDIVFDKNKNSKETAPAETKSELAVVSAERKFQPKDVINIFKLVNLFFQRYTPQVKNLLLTFPQSKSSEVGQPKQNTVGSLMAERYGIKNVNEAIQILNKSSDPREIAKAIMFVSFEKNSNENVDEETFDSVELSLAKKMNEWVQQLRKTKSTSKLKEEYLKKGFDKNIIQSLTNAFVRLAKDPNIDVEEIAKDDPDSSVIDVEAMVTKIAGDDEILKNDILNALSSAEERIQTAQDEQEKKDRILELREFLIAKGFATEENISHVMAALEHMRRGGYVRPHDSTEGQTGQADNEQAPQTEEGQPEQQVNSTEQLKAKVKQMGSTSFFKIAYDIVMDRQKMMSLGIGMGILFICFLVFGAPFLGLLYFAIKAKQAEGGEEQEVEQEVDQNQNASQQTSQQPQQPSALGNLKNAVMDKGKDVVDRTKKAVSAYMNPNQQNP
jgi:hypothetical protein